jgi:hypothetical protein
MPLGEGPIIEENITLEVLILSQAPEGTTGARSNSVSRGERAIPPDPLVGKIGVAIAPYDPEGTDRLIQEF